MVPLQYNGPTFEEGFAIKEKPRRKRLIKTFGANNILAFLKQCGVGITQLDRIDAALDFVEEHEEWTTDTFEQAAQVLREHRSRIMRSMGLSGEQLGLKDAEGA